MVAAGGQHNGAFEGCPRWSMGAKIMMLAVGGKHKQKVVGGTYHQKVDGGRMRHNDQRV